jgi:hypothetical protein
MECNDRVARNEELHDASESGVADAAAASRFAQSRILCSKGNLAVLTASGEEGPFGVPSIVVARITGRRLGF